MKIHAGFTLIELLVVITILAVLAGAALPFVQNYVEESRIAKAKADLEEIARALAVYETREGEYNKPDVSDLTGRYLNKSPIDPWGIPYVVATDSGTVFSKGPDRTCKKDTGNSEDDADNIVVSYQPPLALVSAKWIDRNNSGAVDTKNATDQVQLNFSRKIGVDVASIAAGAPSWFKISSKPNFTDALATDDLQIVASKTIVFYVANDNAFVPGSDTITVQDNNQLYDLASNSCMSGQAVKILPQ